MDILNEKKPRVICTNKSQFGEELILTVLPKTLSSHRGPCRQKPALQFALMLKTQQGLYLPTWNGDLNTDGMDS